MRNLTRKAASIELKHLRSALKYQPKTGNFVWRVARNAYGGGVQPNDIAGTTVIDRDGGSHVNIGLDGRTYRAHRLAWFFMTGEWPKTDVDHEDGIRTHNWWTNLRLATRSQNMGNNHKLRASNVSGKTGVSWVAHCNKWQARVTIDGKHIHLGLFDRDKLDDAIAARREAELKYFGKFAPKDVIKFTKSAKALKALPDTRTIPTLDPRSKSGKTGVAWVNREQQWRVSIHVDGRHIHIKHFPVDQLADAIKARKAAELKYFGKHCAT